jgi:hypothetical protein
MRFSEDGKTVVFRQSWLNRFLLCPEQARLDVAGELEDVNTDAAAIGTATHAGIEWVLKEGGGQGGGIAAVEAELQAIHERGIKYVQVAKLETAMRTAVRCFKSWYEDVQPGLPQMSHIEHPFEVPLDQLDDGTEIRLRGIIDAVDEHGELWDWKTANQPYEPWEAKRFKIQPTCYTYAWAHENELLGQSLTFNYSVISKSNRKPQLIAVERHLDHWSWLAQQCRILVEMHRAELAQWPLVDDGWHCSPKWCSAWAGCKGAHLGEAPW